MTGGRTWWVSCSPASDNGSTDGTTLTRTLVGLEARGDRAGSAIDWPSTFLCASARATTELRQRWHARRSARCGPGDRRPGATTWSARLLRGEVLPDLVLHLATGQILRQDGRQSRSPAAGRGSSTRRSRMTAVAMGIGRRITVVAARCHTPSPTGFGSRCGRCAPSSPWCRAPRHRGSDDRAECGEQRPRCRRTERAEARAGTATTR